MDRGKALKVFAVGILAAIALSSPPATAQDKKLVLRVAHQFSPSDTRYDVKPWMEQVTKATDGEVQFEYYPAEQLGKAKDLLSLTQSGVADIVLFVPSYVSDKMPLTAALELPGLFTNACQGTLAHWKLAKEGSILAQREYAPNGVRVLFSIVTSPYHLISAKNKIESLKDIEGMKVRVLAGAMELTLRKLKAVGVRMPGPELFQALSRGTVDGVAFTYGAAVSPSYNLPAKYVTSGDSFGSAVLVFIISENRWKQLPDSVKKAMAEAGEAAGRNLCAGIDKQEAGDLEKLKQKGAAVVNWSAADKREMDAVTASVASEWAAELDKRGKPGSEVLKAVLEARDSR